MTGFIRVASVKDVSEGEMIGVKVNEKEIMIANLSGRFYAIGNRCTHMKCLLSKGTIEEGKVICPCHFARFDLKTGGGFWGREIGAIPLKPVPIYEVKVQGEDILIKPD
ncbi:MAG: Rieske (2Fe-2S) protein [Nitrososphaerales archaeon]